jgi:putative copper resistance protein D
VGFLALPAPETAIRRLRASLYHLAQGATITIVVAALAQVYIDAAAITVQASPLGVSGTSLLRILAASHTGHDLVFRITGAVFLALQLRPALLLEREGIGAVAGVLLMGPTLTSHGLSVGMWGAAVALVHLAAASIWIGGLIFFGTAYLPTVRTSAPEAVRSAAWRFSRVALLCAGALVITGLIQGWLYVGAPSALASSGYGRTLFAKLAVVGALLATAAINRWGILPRLSGTGATARMLLVLVRVETALALVVALLAATMAISQPGKITGRTPADGDYAVDAGERGAGAGNRPSRAFCTMSLTAGSKSVPRIHRKYSGSSAATSRSGRSLYFPMLNTAWPSFQRNFRPGSTALGSRGGLNNSESPCGVRGRSG